MKETEKTERKKTRKKPNIPQTERKKTRKRKKGMNGWMREEMSNSKLMFLSFFLSSRPSVLLSLENIVVSPSMFFSVFCFVLFYVIHYFQVFSDRQIVFVRNVSSHQIFLSSLCLYVLTYLYVLTCPYVLTCL